MAPLPLPLESHGPSSSAAMASVGGGNGPTISLAMLMDFIIQRTYHELTVLAELLPRKTDMERKIEIFQFAARTRQLFIRLLALVKWANSVSKVEKSSTIMAFLDKQSMVFVETADALSRMARETLVHARLPNFHLPAAIEVLTTGSYSRLPLCIREKIIPPDPITPAEKRTTLLRLNQVIEHRLVTNPLPLLMRNLRIENGRVKFIVEHEFEVSLTVMGDDPNIPWRLLEIDFLVEDKETGDGKTLVHSLQIHYIHQLVQTRLIDHPQPLAELYIVLHNFCQSLQLEVLHSQTMRLCQDRLGDMVRVEEYVPAKHLTVSYWRELASRELKSDLGYRLTVHVDAHDPSRLLMVAHHPPLASKDSEQAEKAIRSDQLSMEKLLIHTVHMRSKTKLTELKQELQVKLGSDIECLVQGSPAVLHVPILQPCLRSEQLLITVDSHTGHLQAHLPQDDPPANLMHDLNQALNNNRAQFDSFVSELRFWIVQKRCEKTLQHLPVSLYDKLPLLMSADHRLAKLEKHRLMLRLYKHPNTVVVVEFKDKPDSPCEVQFVYHLITVRPCSIEDDPQDEAPQSDLPKMYLRVLNIIDMDAFLLTHGPFTSIDGQDVSEKILGKRKATTVGKTEALVKKSRCPSYIFPDLAHMVALCDERISFAALATELTEKEILHQGLCVEAPGTNLALKIMQMPNVEGIERSAMVHLQKTLLSLTFRMHCKGARAWIAELLFYGTPVPTVAHTEQSKRFPVYLTYEMNNASEMSRTVEALVQDWSQIAHLFAIVSDFADYFKQERIGLSSMVTLKSYNYRRLVLAYGPGGIATAMVAWKASEKRFSVQFGASTTQQRNPHCLLKEQLELFLNQRKNLSYFVRVLHETYLPLTSLCKLSYLPQLGTIAGRVMQPVLTFTLLPQSPFHVRLAYQNMYCLDIHVRGDGLVSIRDGAYSLFDKSKVIEEFSPTQGLKAFLSKYVTETSILRRRSQSEDDHPPSPVTLESNTDASNMGNQVGGRDGRFHPPMTPPPMISNPNTPASDLNSLSQTNHFGMSPAAVSFPLPSPPSLSSAINPSPSTLPHPSPNPNAFLNSPLNPLHAPSPANMLPIPSPNPTSVGTPGSAQTMQLGHSPASSFLQHVESSPFPSSLASPAPPAWPNSPSLPRPSPRGATTPHSMTSFPPPTHSVARVLPQRSWAGAIPTLLAQPSFDTLCTPATLSMEESESTGGKLSPLERFLGCVYMRRQLQRVIQEEDFLTALPCSEPGSIQFRCETLQGRVSVNLQHLQCLHLKLTPTPEFKDQWAMEELQVVEKFYETRVMAPPYKPYAVVAFGKLINVPFRILRDLVQIMRLDLFPALIHQQNWKWTLNLYLVVPPSASPIVPIGMNAVLTAKNKVLFFLHLRRIGMNPEADGASLVLPLVYDIGTNVTQLAERRDTSQTGGMGPPSHANPAIHAASQMLKRYAEYLGMQPNGECSIFPAVRELLANLTLPNEQPMQMQMNMGNMGNNMGAQVMPPMPLQNQGNPMMGMQQSGMQMPVQMPMQSPYGGQGMGPNMMQ